MFETPVKGVPMPLPFLVRDLIGICKVSNGSLLFWSKNLDSLLSFVCRDHNPIQADTAETLQDPRGSAAGSIRPAQSKKTGFQNMVDRFLADSCMVTYKVCTPKNQS